MVLNVGYNQNAQTVNSVYNKNSAKSIGFGTRIAVVDEQLAGIIYRHKRCQEVKSFFDSFLGEGKIIAYPKIENNWLVSTAKGCLRKLTGGKLGQVKYREPKVKIFSDRDGCRDEYYGIKALCTATDKDGTIGTCFHKLTSRDVETEMDLLLHQHDFRTLRSIITDAVNNANSISQGRAKFIKEEKARKTMIATTNEEGMKMFGPKS